MLDQLMDFFTSLSGHSGYVIIFLILLACGLGVPIPEDIALAGGGLLAAEGEVNVWGMIAVGMVGVLLGDCIIFWLGHRYGRRVTKFWLFRKVLSEERLQQVKEGFNKKGYRMIFFARFMPGLRAPVFFSSGTLHLPFKIFILYDGLAALISVPTIVYLVYYLGEDVIAKIRKVEHGIAIILLLLLVSLGVHWFFSRKKKVQAA